MLCHMLLLCIQSSFMLAGVALFGSELSILYIACFVAIFLQQAQANFFASTKIRFYLSQN